MGDAGTSVSSSTDGDEDASLPGDGAQARKQWKQLMRMVTPHLQHSRFWGGRQSGCGLPQREMGGPDLTNRGPLFPQK